VWPLDGVQLGRTKKIRHCNDTCNATDNQRITQPIPTIFVLFNLEPHGYNGRRCSGVVLPTLRFYTIEIFRFFAFVLKKNLTNVYLSL
jgi:hypothetical protein